MEFIKNKINNLKRGFKEFHTKKPHIEFFTALLTIPVLLTVIILNVNNLKGEADSKEPENDSKQTIVITQPSTEEKEVVVTKEACEPGIGDISISTPEENETVTDNPVTVHIDYDAGDYCEVVWSYRVNGGSWSSYDDTSISLYNLPNGEVKLDLRVKSVVNSDNESISRNFRYEGAESSPTPTLTVSPTPAE